MAEQKIEQNMDCKSQMHDKHLCHLMYEGFHLTNPQEYRDIVQDAQFRCQNCGRTANSEEALCAPVSL